MIDRHLERSLYLRGIELFNRHQFFEAHEIWEDAWRQTVGDRRSFYQGLIQCAVALEHYRRSNPRGMRSLSRSYPTKFANLPRVYLGLNVQLFLREMHESLRHVIELDPLPERGTVTLDLDRVPKITLIDNAFEMTETTPGD